jgi:hypothetical protein
MAIYAQLSCEMPRDPRMIAAGPLGRLVYIEAMLYCRENLTDGIIDRLALIFWCPDVPVKTRAKHLDRLTEVGALEQVSDGWQFPEHVWSRWNPSKAEVEGKREAERQRKADYRAKRHASPNDVPTGQVRPATGRPRQPEEEPEPEPKEERSHHLSTTPIRLVQPVDDDRLESVLSKIVQLRAAKANPRSPHAWAAKVRRQVETDEMVRIRDYMDRYPDAPYDVIAAAVEGDTHSLAHYTSCEQTG